MASRMPAVLCALLLLTVSAKSGQQSTVTPVQKVIQLLENMVTQGESEKQAGQVQFAKFKSFCDSTVTSKHNAIDEANEMIDMLTADIQKFDVEAAQLGKEIAQHDADISTWEGDLDAATKVREIENTDYIATAKDYGASIDAVDEGIATLKAQQKDVKQSAAALAQLSVSNLIPPKSRRILDAFLNAGKDQSLLAVSAPEARAYESQTTGVTDMLTGLGGKFEKEKKDLDNEEAEAKHTFEKLAMDLRQQIDLATTARTEKAEAKARALQASADAKGSLADTTGTRDADEKYVEELVATCEQKSAAFADRQQLRGDEIDAVQQAIGILSSGAVSGASEKNLPQLMQLGAKSAAALAQLRGDTRSPSQLRVAAYLKTQAVKINSRVLSALATRVGADPFKKVKKMIKDLIVKLMEEAQAETEHKGWCDTEMATNKHTREEKTEAVELLTADIDQLQASVASLTDEIAELTQNVAEIDEAVAKSTAIRTEERAKNKQVIKEAQEAQVAVEKALAVLNDFYAKASEATSFTQASHRAEPEIFSDEPYTGMVRRAAVLLV